MQKIKKIFSKETTFEEKLLILKICLAYGSCSICFNGIAFWFQTPELYCRDHETLKKSVCSEEFACNNPYVTLHINRKSGPYSLTGEFSLICDNKIYQRMLMSALFFGGLLGCLMNAIIIIHPRKRKLAISVLCMTIMFAKIGVVLLNDNFYFLGFFLGLISFSAIILNSYSFALLNENFVGEVAKISTVMMSIIWGCFGIAYSVFCYLISSDWRIIFIMGAIIFLFLSIAFFPIQKGQNQDKGFSEKKVKLIYTKYNLNRSQI